MIGGSHGGAHLKSPLRRGLKGLEVSHRLRCPGGGGEDGAAVGLHEREPLREILRMIGARCAFSDAELGAQKG